MQLSNVLMAWVCMSIRLFRFFFSSSVYLVTSTFVCVTWLMCTRVSLSVLSRHTFVYSFLCSYIFSHLQHSFASAVFDAVKRNEVCNVCYIG